MRAIRLREFIILSFFEVNGRTITDFIITVAMTHMGAVSASASPAPTAAANYCVGQGQERGRKENERIAEVYISVTGGNVKNIRGKNGYHRRKKCRHNDINELLAGFFLFHRFNPPGLILSLILTPMKAF